MPQRTRTPVLTLSREPRTIPVTCPDLLDFASAAMAGGISSSNFSLTSIPEGRRYLGSKSGIVPSGPYSSSDDYSLSTPSAANHSSLTVTDTQFISPVMSAMDNYDSSEVFEFLADDAFSGTYLSGMNVLPTNYPGQAQTEDLMNAPCMLVDVSMYNPGYMSGHYPSDVSWQNRVLTPPPEDFVHSFLSAQTSPEESCRVDQDVSLYGPSIPMKSPTYSAARRSVVQPRPIRSASERSVSPSEHSLCTVSTAETHSIKDEPLDKLKARSDPLYDARPDGNGEYHCPKIAELKCNHAPTRQKCIYNKYVDSHLRPYRCKFADRPECEDARFSSNACLFRHEREAHGLHNHGVNPFLCKFPDCDRAREGNGFPRRWNQRDHMKRVHDYIEPTSPKAARAAAAVDSNKRRKTPSSTPMRRSNSSAASKAQAMANAALPVRTNGRSVSQACYGAPCTSAIPVVDRDAMTRQPSLDKVQITATATFSRTSRDHRC